MAAVQFFSLPQVIMLSTATGANGTLNFPLNRTDFKVYRSLLNTIQVLIRDVDRQPVTFAQGITPTAIIVDRHTQSVLFTGPLTLLDQTQSLWQFTIGPLDIDDWQIGLCDYSIVTEDANGNLSALYTDRGYSTNGTVEILQGPFPKPVSASVLPASTFLTRNQILYSTSVAGSAQVNNLSGLSTLAFYGEGFTGQIMAQGVLDNDVPEQDSQWLPIETFSVSELTGVASFSFCGNFYWVRLAISTTSGSFTQVLLRS